MEYEIPKYLEGQKAFYKSKITGSTTEIEIRSVFVVFSINADTISKQVTFTPKVKIRSSIGTCYDIDEVFTELTDYHLKVIEIIKNFKENKRRSLDDILERFKQGKINI